MKIIEETPYGFRIYGFRIEQEGAMRVPGIVFASRSSLPDEHGDMALAQVADVATLPGIVRAGMRRRSSAQLEGVGAWQRLPGSGPLPDGCFRPLALVRQARVRLAAGP